MRPAARGIASRFVPTGQTGIAIAGWGLSVDAVVADFIAGAAERLVVEGSERGGDLLLVEGQGSITHPAYSGVTLGLIHGSAPHAYVLCHMAGTTEVEGYEGYPLLSLPKLVALHEAISLTRRPAGRRLHRAQHPPPRRRRGARGDRGGGGGDGPRRRRPGSVRCRAPARRRARPRRATLVTQHVGALGCRALRGPGRRAANREIRAENDGNSRVLWLRSRSRGARLLPTSARTTTRASSRPTRARCSSARWARSG